MMNLGDMDKKDTGFPCRRDGLEIEGLGSAGEAMTARRAGDFDLPSSPGDAHLLSALGTGIVFVATIGEIVSNLLVEGADRTGQFHELPVFLATAIVVAREHADQGDRQEKIDQETDIDVPSEKQARRDRKDHRDDDQEIIQFIVAVAADHETIEPVSEFIHGFLMVFVMSSW